MILVKKILLVSILLITITLSWLFITNSQTESKLEKIIEFDENISGYVTLTNSDLLILTLFGEEDEIWVEWNQGGKILKRIDNIAGCKYSPDGKYYAYLNLNDKTDKTIHINNNNDETIAVIELGEYGADLFWTYNSKYLLINKSPYIADEIYKYNILEKTSEQILKSNIFYAPVVVGDENTIYFLTPENLDAPGTESNIVRYDLLNKKFEKLSFPFIEKLWIFDDYTVSPNGKIVAFQNCHREDSALYVINLENSKIIDRVPFSYGQLTNYYWKPDSSYFVFTPDSKVFYKYTIPKY